MTIRMSNYDDFLKDYKSVVLGAEIPENEIIETAQQRIEHSASKEEIEMNIAVLDNEIKDVAVFWFRIIPDEEEAESYVVQYTEVD